MPPSSRTIGRRTSLRHCHITRHRIDARKIQAGRTAAIVNSMSSRRIGCDCIAQEAISQARSNRAFADELTERFGIPIYQEANGCQGGGCSARQRALLYQHSCPLDLVVVPLSVVSASRRCRLQLCQARLFQRNPFVHAGDLTWINARGAVLWLSRLHRQAAIRRAKSSPQPIGLASS